MMNHKEKRKYLEKYFSKMARRLYDMFNDDPMLHPKTIEYDIFCRYFIVDYLNRRYTLQLVDADDHSSTWWIVSDYMPSPKEWILTVRLDETYGFEAGTRDTLLSKFREMYKHECQFYGIPDNFTAQFVTPYPVVIRPEKIDKEKVHESIRTPIDKSSET